MTITFIPLSELHFPLLLKWLETPHVKAWWPVDRNLHTDGNQNIQWTPELIRKKYDSYTKEYKLEKGVAKTIRPYIIFVDETPVGYIQIYNAYDFARSKPLNGLPPKLAAFDVFIGEKNYLKRGIGSKAIIQFLYEYHGCARPIRQNNDRGNWILSVVCHPA